MADPYRNFKFEVEVLGFVRAGFSKVTGLSHSVESIDYREGGENETNRKLPGQSTFNDVTLERGMTNDRDFETWMRQIFNLGIARGFQGIPFADDFAFRKTINIYVRDKPGVRRVKYTLINAWPKEYSVGDLDASANDVLIETLVLANEGIDMLKLV